MVKRLRSLWLLTTHGREDQLNWYNSTWETAELNANINNDPKLEEIHIADER